MKLINNRYGKFFLKLFVSAGLAAWLIFKINWSEVLGYAQKISLLQIILYVAVLLFGMIVSSYKWKILADFKGFNFPLQKYFKLYLTGTFINNFFPSFIGGDTYKAYQISKLDKRYLAASATVVIDRITGLLAALVLSIFFALLNWKVVFEHSILIYILAGAILFLICVLLLPFVAKFNLWKKITSKVPTKINEIVVDFAEYWGSSALNKSFFLSVFFSLIGIALVNYVLFWSLGINIGIIDYLTVIFLISFVSALPVSINNIGIKEWAYVTFFGFFGVAASAVVTVALVSRILQMIVSFAALPMYIRNKK